MGKKKRKQWEKEREKGDWVKSWGKSDSKLGIGNKIINPVEYVPLCYRHTYVRPYGGLVPSRRGRRRAVGRTADEDRYIGLRRALYHLGRPRGYVRFGAHPGKYISRGQAQGGSKYFELKWIFALAFLLVSWL